MQYESQIFKNRKFDFEKLLKFGFKFLKNRYTYKTTILDNSFEATIIINSDETIEARLVETVNGEDYNLIFVKNAGGEFVGKVREAFENILIEIRDKCTFFSAFQSEYANLVIKYIEEKYDSPAEFLWKKTPEACIFRKKDNSKTGGKWFAALLAVPKSKIGLSGDEIIEIIDLKAKPEKIQKIVDNKKYFEGYHMNKKHWFTICLDGSVHIDEIKTLIDESYQTL